MERISCTITRNRLLRVTRGSGRTFVLPRSGYARDKTAVEGAIALIGRHGTMKDFCCWDVPEEVPDSLEFLTLLHGETLDSELTKLLRTRSLPKTNQELVALRREFDAHGTKFGNPLHFKADGYEIEFSRSSTAKFLHVYAVTATSTKVAFRFGVSTYVTSLPFRLYLLLRKSLPKFVTACNRERLLGAVTLTSRSTGEKTEIDSWGDEKSTLRFCLKHGATLEEAALILD